MQTILGIDPGSRVTGFGIIRSDGNRHQYVASGCVRVGNGVFNQRLEKIFRDLSDVVDLYNPDVAAIEQVFMHTNANSALKLGHARGAAIVAVATNNLLIHEYSARQVKQAVVGYGAAAKDQVQHMIKTLLKLEGELQEDAADALAVALCHAHAGNRRLR